MKGFKRQLVFLIYALVLFILPAAVYSENITGTVIDGATDNPLSAVTVEIYDDDRVTLIISVETNAAGVYEATDIPIGGIYITFSLTDYVPTFGDYTLQESVETISLGDTPLVPTDGGLGTIDGRVIDASTDDDYIPEVLLQLREGINQIAGSALYEVTSDASDPGPDLNTYEFTDVPPGTYTLLAIKDGFSDVYLTVISIGGETKTYGIGMSRTLTAGSIRIVLSWGENPRDIDSHLHTPEIEGSTYEVYYASRGSLDAPPYAQLDRDDVTSYGPETVTITELYSGTYRYAVEYYAGSGTLGSSGAVVQVYDDNGLYATYNVPPSAGNDPPQMGDEWTVFYINGDTGEITSTEPSSSVTSSEQVLNLVDSDECFIATAAYGSPLNPHIKILREFRDRFLLNNTIGINFVEIYYTCSPPVADFIAGHPYFRTMVRLNILPLVGASWAAINIGPTPTLAIIVLLLTLIISTIITILRKGRARRLKRLGVISC